MSQKELRRLGVLSRVAAEKLKLVEATELLRLSYRQVKRLWRIFRGQGPEGFKHGNAGRRSSRAKPEKFRRQVLGLVRKHYGGEPGERFGPTLAADDATGITLAQLGAEETTWAAADCSRAWVEKYGIPQALYTDWKNVYLREPTPQEQLPGEAPLTQFGRMCAKRGVRILGASSPQAKGRCERKHGVHQDRLIKLLRLPGIAIFEETNQYLQLEPNRKRYLPAGSKVVVEQWRDGSLHVVYRQGEVARKAIEALPQRHAAAQRKLVRPPQPAVHKPRADHPWRQMRMISATGKAEVFLSGR